MTEPPAGYDERERLIWQLGYNAGREQLEDRLHELEDKVQMLFNAYNSALELIERLRLGVRVP